MIPHPTPEARRVWARIERKACPMEGCEGSWVTNRPFYASCTVDPSHVFKKEDLLHGRVVPIIPTPSEEA